MARKVNITCRYFWVKKYTDNGKDAEIFDLREWLYKVKDVELKDLVKPIGDDKGRLENTAKRDNFYALNFIRMEQYSSMYYLSSEERAKHVHISIENDEYIGKNTVALYDADNGILMVMNNRGGFSPNTITNYINAFYDEPICVLEPIKMKKDFQNPHSKYGKISIKINSVREFRPSKGAVYESALNAAEEMDAESFSFEFSVGRKKNTYLDANVVRSIISDAFNNMGAVSIARVKMTDEQGTDLYNLFDNVKHSIFTMNADNNGEIAFKDISDKMLEAYSRAKI